MYRIGAQQSHIRVQAQPSADLVLFLRLARAFNDVETGTQNSLRFAIERRAGIVAIVLGQDFGTRQEQAPAFDGDLESGRGGLPFRQRPPVLACDSDQQLLGGRRAEQTQHMGSLRTQTRVRDRLLHRRLLTDQIVEAVPLRPFGEPGEKLYGFGVLILAVLH